MKILKYFFVLLFLVLITEVNGQSIKWADETPNNFKLNVTVALGYTGNSIFLLKNRRDDRYEPIKYIIDRYDLPDMKKIYSKEIWGTEDGTDNGKLLHMDKIFCLDEGIVVIAQSHDYKTVYAMQLRINDGLLLDSRKDTLGQFYSKNGEQITQLPYKFIVSKDRSTLIGYFLSGINPVIHMIAIDAHLNIKWTFNYIPSFASKDFDVKQVASLDGNEFGILTAIHDKTDPKNLTYCTITCNPKKNSKFETMLNLGEGLTLDVPKIDFDKSGNPYVVGYFKNIGNRGSYGTFGFRINVSTGNVIAKGFTPFTSDFLSKYVSGTKAANGDGIIDLNIKETSITENDEILITTERIIPRIELYTPGNDVGADSRYHYTDIIVTKLNGKNCTSKWISVVPKKQYSYEGLTNSFVSIIRGDTMSVIFSDNRQNANLDLNFISQYPDKLNIAYLDKSLKNLYMVNYSLDINTGKVTRETPKNKNDNEAMFNLLTFTPLLNSIFVYRGDTKTDQAGVLTLH